MSPRKTATKLIAFTALTLAIGTAAAGTPRNGEFNTVRYNCDKGGEIEVSYYFGAPRAYALIEVNGRTLKLNARDDGNEEQSSFSNGSYTWRGENLYEASIQDSTAFLTRGAMQRVNGKRIRVDETIYKSCSAVK